MLHYYQISNLTWFPVCAYIVYGSQYNLRYNALECHLLQSPIDLVYIIVRYFYARNCKYLSETILSNYHWYQQRQTLIVEAHVHEQIAVWSSAGPKISKRLVVHPRVLSAMFLVLLCCTFLTSWSWLGLWRHCRCQWLRQIQNADGECGWFTKFRPWFTSYVVIFVIILYPYYISYAISYLVRR